MNLRETIRSGYKIFSRMGAEKQKAHILALQYIELLASQTNTKMEPWDLLQVFGVGKGSELITDKTEINKRFFAKVEEIKTSTPAAVFALEQRISDQIDTITRANVDREIANLKRNRDSYITEANRAQERAMAQLVEARRVEVNIMSLERRESTVAGQIAQILQENFYEFHQLSGENLDLITKNDLILTHKNTAASIDLRVNMGRVRVVTNLKTMAMTVHEFERNIRLSDGYFHPHIAAPSGSICWGTGVTAAQQGQAKGEVANVLRLLASVLINYNDGNPYRSLAEFQKKAERDAPPKDAPPPLPPEMEAGRARALGAVSEVRESATPSGLGFARSRWEAAAVPGGIMAGIMATEDARMMELLREAAAAPIGYSLSRVGLAGHPTDSTQPAQEGCECNICRVSRESARRQEEFNSMQGMLRSGRPLFTMGSSPPIGPEANVEAFLGTATAGSATTSRVMADPDELETA